MVLAPRIHGSDLKKYRGSKGSQEVIWIDWNVHHPRRDSKKHLEFVEPALLLSGIHGWHGWHQCLWVHSGFNVRLQETVWNSCPSLSKLSQSGYPRHYILLYIYRPTGVFSIRSHSSSTLCRRNSGWCPVSIISGGQVWNRPYDTLRYSYIHV